ncbi:deazaflavin-dependent oxidoreductase, nitroreductase family [Streptomyces sp. DvalAA-14]|uniref:nitroreductase family deazaflavin-dependent oxidoreductase n=1 Tax=unclassified Streptomyces TaxID=2593676 RepID=UPI00081B2B16|nr:MULTISPECIES: nitroreductase family deazaflavin-dependent oxidoreductase [unclassified Streptomyces]MYS21051.1 nitroreductase family deazaflavin-dependent oxidoreductase [Streptomyces sp. SID4948]SCD82960.1 deazaflavin-dependent oxidoreductase, nitroreductase family [Streptomyces sp. DvalAA-14]
MSQQPTQSGRPAGSADALHVKKPGWITVNVLNRSVGWLTRRGFSVWGSRVLAVRGRKSGEWRRTPVNLLTVDGQRYLVAPRGHVQWTHNMRAAGGGQLLLGKKVEEFAAAEVSDDDKPVVLRAYLKRWKAEVGVFFDGVGPDSTDEELRAIAPRHPVFRILPAEGA